MALEQTADKGSAGQRDPERTSVATVLEKELLLIGLLILLVGLLFTDAYYDTFGIHYQFLELPTSYFIYRGLTAVGSNPWLVLPYALTLLIMLFLGQQVPAQSFWRSLPPKLLLYLLIPLIILLGGTMAQKAGEASARQDLVNTSSSLPQIVSLRTAQGQLEEALSKEQFPARLLLSTGQDTMLFVPRGAGEGEETTVPRIIRIPTGDVHELKTAPR